jgi:hypothetical protein
MGGPGPTGRPYPTALECRAVDAPTGGGQGQARARARARAEGEAWPTPRTWRCYWSAPGCAPGGGAGARPIRGTRGQRVENPRWTERWRGVLRHVPQRTVQRTPCVPLALSGYGCELRSCTSTARRPYGIPTRTVWYCIGRWSQVRREGAGRGPACGAAHRRTPVEGSRHVRVRRLASPAARHGPGAMYAQRATLQPECLAAGAPHGTQAITDLSATICPVVTSDCYTLSLRNDRYP